MVSRLNGSPSPPIHDNDEESPDMNQFNTFIIVCAPIVKQCPQWTASEISTGVSRGVLSFTENYNRSPGRHHIIACRIRTTAHMGLTSKILGLAWTATALAASYIGVTAYHEHWSKDKADIIYEKTRRNQTILERCKTLLSEYATPLWGMNSHLQTGYNSLFRNVQRPEYHRERLYASDGGLIVMDWLLAEEDDLPKLFGLNLSAGYSKPEIEVPTEEPREGDMSRTDFSHQDASSSSSTSERPTVIISPGICNNSDAHYIRGFSAAAQKAGYRVVIFTPRGCAELATTVKLFTWGDTSDLECAIHHVQELFPRSPLLGVSFSLGANLMGRYVGRQGKIDIDFCREREKREPNYKQPLTLVVAVSLNANGHEAIKHLKTRYPNTYYAFLSKKLVNLLERHQEAFAKELDVKELVKSIRTVEDYDREFSCKVDPSIAFETYYLDQSCKDDLRNITVPTLILNALDDPLVPSETLPKDLPSINHNVTLALTNHGGHLGWAQTDSNGGPLSFLVPSETHWHDIAILEWIRATLDVLREEKEEKEEEEKEEEKEEQVTVAPDM
ncbi:hypothetical protein PROFUN_07133 [Planoprotostelium fungivorum]|uniref:AB hydrolase-1 domain-containing protein n=1 Tax=Planoprotostelium fungivorum TaxID=1890364 RepID=A0A2P6NMJ4_9EUKA|nr:hypothetical protein PROFUN_07133 [Planoprotostelium fungivorum]